MSTLETFTPDEFLHGLARFRSAQRMEFLELATIRHNYHTALAIQKSFKKHTGQEGLIACLEAQLNKKIVAFYVKFKDETFDIFGSSAAQRYLEFSFQDDIDSYTEITFHSTESLLEYATDNGFFFDYWEPNPEFSDLITNGITSAISDFRNI